MNNLIVGIIKKGYGYWDTTHYPYGGCFHRAKEDTSIQVGKPSGKFPSQVREIHFLDGRTGVADLNALVFNKELEK